MELADDFKIDTSGLAMFRQLAANHRQLAEVIGNIFQVRVIIDANVVISDLRQKILFPERGKTALEELMASSVLVVVAPRWLEAEMSSAITQYAESSGIPVTSLRFHWEQYRKLLVWDETYPSPVDTPLTHVDSKDAPYVFTQWIQNAIGVLSKDGHISRMGGNRLTLDFVFSVRSYARAKVVAITIKVGGAVVCAVAISILIEVVKALGSVINKIPSRAWLIFLLGITIILIANPEARKWIGEQYDRLKIKLTPILASITASMQEGAAIAYKKDLEAAEHLSDIESYRKPVNVVRQSRRPTARRRRRKDLPVSSQKAV